MIALYILIGLALVLIAGALLVVVTGDMNRIAGERL